MGQQTADTLKELLGEERAAFLDYLQEPTRDALTAAIRLRLQADANSLNTEIKSGVSRLPGWLKGIASNALKGDA